MNRVSNLNRAAGKLLAASLAAVLVLGMMPAMPGTSGGVVI